MRKITRSIGAGAESCTQVRAQSANFAKNVQNLCFLFFQKPFVSAGGGGGGGGGGRQKKISPGKFFSTQVRRNCQEI